MTILNNETQKLRKIRIVAPYAHTYKMKVKQYDEGKTVHQILADRLSFRSHDEWGVRLANGLISQNGQVLKGSEFLKSGESVDLYNHYVTEPSVPNEVAVISESEDWLAVWKPAPMPIHPGGRYFKNTLISLLAEQGYENLQIIHRLDAVTSGLVLLGKNPDFTKAAHQRFSQNAVQKKYLARVSGLPVWDTITIDKAIKRKKSFVFELSDHPEAKSAKTSFRVLERRHDGTSLIECYPETGRTHQLRLHLKESGHPIVDDYIYNPACPNYSEFVQNAAISLVNSSLEIPDLGISLSLSED